MPAQVLTIVGPTASGKTRLAVELARRFNGEVVSCDSMQIYRHMDIGTAKPTAEEMCGVVHHMLDVADPDENYSAARYVEQASACVDDILARGKLPVIAGGTGLYRDALLAGRTFAAFSGRYRSDLEQRAAAGELTLLYEELQRIDPDRADLWARIDRRVDEMMVNGLTDEVEALLASGVPDKCTAMQAIGYKEMVAALREGRPPESGAEEVKLRSRQYAKRQLTWFRRNPATEWHLWDRTPDFSTCLQHATDLIVENGLV